MRPERLIIAAVLLLTTVAASAANLGTLFFTPEERARLDKQRRGEPEVPAATPGKPEVTGFVRRSDGRNTVWINGVPLSVAGEAADTLMDPGTMRGSRDRDLKIERTDKTRVK